MMQNRRVLIAIAAVLLAAVLLAAVPVLGVEVEVKIENLAPDAGNLLTPVWVGFHDGSFDSYDRGAPLAGAFERIAEDGNTAPLTDEFTAFFGTPQATVPGPGGAIAPGETASRIFDLDGSDAATRYFSYVSMVIPSNDAFIANGDPLAHRVFDPSGNLTPLSFVIYGADVLDAGTEVNDELPTNTAAFGQAAPNTGVAQNGVVDSHPGFLPAGSGGILDDPAFAGATFRAPGYEIARVTITPVRNTTFSFSAAGDQQVPLVVSDSSAACRGILSSDETRITFLCQHDVEDAIAAHIHQAPRGETGAIIFPFESFSSPIEETFDATPDHVATLLASGFYVNVHSTAHPTGEVRGQIDGCFASPTNLCLNDGRFQVSATWETSTRAGGARGFELTEDSGVFYFFRPGNIELDVKVLDACESNGFFWVFAAGLTNQGAVLTVLDTVSGETQRYENPLGRQFEPILDTGAFETCP